MNIKCKLSAEDGKVSTILRSKSYCISIWISQSITVMHSHKWLSCEHLASDKVCHSCMSSSIALSAIQNLLRILYIPCQVAGVENPRSKVSRVWWCEMRLSSTRRNDSVTDRSFIARDFSCVTKGRMEPRIDLLGCHSITSL